MELGIGNWETQFLKKTQYLIPNSQLLFSKLLYLVAALDLVDEYFCRLEAWDKMLFDYDRSVARNVAGNFFLSFFVYETSEAANVDIMSARHGVFYNGKEGFYRSGYICFIDACLFCDLINNVCFRHVAGVLLLEIRDGKINFRGQN